MAAQRFIIEDNGHDQNNVIKRIQMPDKQIYFIHDHRLDDLDLSVLINGNTLEWQQVEKLTIDSRD